ncbi:DUF2946 family protein [Stenotrophomonas sp. TWI700]|uniref:DUF2946 family protein n=1 Tax=Stenotrophomonas sp. TWI700 TaxID=3136792 RepID=UPI00320B8F4F
MLLVVVAPLISRAIAHPEGNPVQATDAHAGHHTEMEPEASQMPDALPMHHGIGHGMDHAMPMVPESADTAGPDTTPSKTSADPHAEHEMGVDCDYCLIAARMISLLVVLLLVMTTWPAVFHAFAGLVDTRRILARGTLGARGPPSALAF